MTRLPKVGGDDNSWGTILNDFLGVAHSSDGKLLPSAVSESGALLGEIDSSDSDIQGLGSQAAGSVGKVADAGHVHQMPRLDQVASPTSDVSLNSRRLKDVASPTSATDAVSKQYVDEAVAVAIALG